MELIVTSAAFVFAAVPAMLFLRNLRLYRPPLQAGRRLPAVSVLIPARNEEKVIGAAVAAALANEGISLEVLVLDDGSTDATAVVVNAIGAVDSRARLVRANPLPPGWCGKQHACAELALRAKHPVICFIDADVRLRRDALARMVTFLETSGADLVSGVPHQETATLLEKLLIPLIHFVLLAFLPVARMRRSSDPAYGAGCGQLFVARADAYRRAGGHAAIRATLHDGLNLPRAFRRAGLKTDLFDATDVATCRMYQSNGDVWRGLRKNAGEGLGSPALILPATVILMMGQVAPLPLLVMTSGSARAMAMGALVFSYLGRVAAMRRFDQPLVGTVLHPVSVLLLLIIQWHALARRAGGGGEQWKGRSYSPAAGQPR